MPGELLGFTSVLFYGFNPRRPHRNSNLGTWSAAVCITQRDWIGTTASVGVSVEAVMVELRLGYPPCLVRPSTTALLPWDRPDGLA